MRNNTCDWQVVTPWAPELEALGFACEDWFGEAHLCDGADPMRLLWYAMCDKSPAIESIRIYAGPYTLAAMQAWGAYSGARALQIMGHGTDDLLEMCRDFLATLYCAVAPSSRIAYGLGRTIYLYPRGSVGRGGARAREGRKAETPWAWPTDAWEYSFAPSFCSAAPKPCDCGD